MPDPGDYPQNGCCEDLVCERRRDRYGHVMNWKCYEVEVEVEVDNAEIEL
jgi:hypothetical protein